MGGHPAGQVERRARWPVRLGAAMPFEQERVEPVHRPEQLGRGLHEPPEQGHPETEVGGHDRRRACFCQGTLDRLSIGRPAGRRDDEPPDAGLEPGLDVGSYSRSLRRVDHDVGAADRRPVVSIEGRPADDRDAFSAFASGSGDGPAQRAVAQDDGLHGSWSSLHVGPRQVAEDNKKPRSPSWCRGPWSLRSLEAPVRRLGRAVRAPGPVPPGRAARASSSIPRRNGGSYREPYAYFGIDATITLRLAREGSRVYGNGTSRSSMSVRLKLRRRMRRAPRSTGRSSRRR